MLRIDEGAQFAEEMRIGQWPDKIGRGCVKTDFLCGIARSDGIAIEHDDVWEWGYRSWGFVRRLALLMIFVG